MNFKVGDKVVCIDPVGNLKKGQVYTVKRFEYFHGEQIIDIGEKSYVSGVLGEISWYTAKRFRKLSNNSLSRELAEEFIENDKKVKEQEYEKVLTLSEEF